MFKLFNEFEAATHDAWTAEALMDDATSRYALRTDPESAHLGLELRKAVVGDAAGERKARTARRDRGVRMARRQALS